MKNILLINNEGFLGQAHKENIDKIRKNYNDLFSLIEKINKLIYDMYDNIDIKNNDVIGMYLLASFVKTHKSFQSSTILYNYGLEDDVHILFRTMFENLFVSTSIKKDENNYQKLVKNQEIEDNQKTNDLIDVGILKQEKNKINRRDITTVWQFAFDAGLKDIFVAYSYLSPYIHPDLRNLEKKFDKKNNEVYGINLAPSVDDIYFILTEMIGLMLSYIDLIKDYSKENYDNSLNELRKEHTTLHKKCNV